MSIAMPEERLEPRRAAYDCGGGAAWSVAESKTWLCEAESRLVSEGRMSPVWGLLPLRFTRAGVSQPGASPESPTKAIRL